MNHPSFAEKYIALSRATGRVADLRGNIVEAKDIPPVPAPEEPPPEPAKKVRRVQGLKASSFAKSGQTGLTVRAGTTLSTAATDKTLSIEEAKESTAVSYAAATVQPRLKRRPPLEIPESVIEQEIEGSVKITIDIDEHGLVSGVKLTKSLHPDADAACLRSWKQATFHPAKQGEDPVRIVNFPRRCRFKSLN